MRRISNKKIEEIGAFLVTSIVLVMGISRLEGNTYSPTFKKYENPWDKESKPTQLIIPNGEVIRNPVDGSLTNLGSWDNIMLRQNAYNDSVWGR